MQSKRLSTKFRCMGTSRFKPNAMYSVKESRTNTNLARQGLYTFAGYEVGQTLWPFRSNSSQNISLCFQNPAQNQLYED